jgi:hypothetical protein
MAVIRIKLPAQLQILAGAASEVQLPLKEPVTQRSALDALEACYPAIRGTIRDQVSGQRRPYLRFFACQEDLSHRSADDPLPEDVIRGVEPFYIIGAISGG